MTLSQEHNFSMFLDQKNSMALAKGIHCVTQYIGSRKLWLFEIKFQQNDDGLTSKITELHSVYTDPQSCMQFIKIFN